MKRRRGHVRQVTSRKTDAERQKQAAGDRRLWRALSLTVAALSSASSSALLLSPLSLCFLCRSPLCSHVRLVGCSPPPLPLNDRLAVQSPLPPLTHSQLTLDEQQLQTSSQSQSHFFRCVATPPPQSLHCCRDRRLAALRLLPSRVRSAAARRLLHCCRLRQPHSKRQSRAVAAVPLSCCSQR